MLLHAIGNGGDSQTPNAPGNFSPLTPTREVTASFVDASDQQVGTSVGSLLFDEVSGSFSGEVFIDTIATSGAYSIKLKTPRYLSKRSPGFITITDPDLQETFSLLQTTLVVGDSNDDNSLDILDYNMLIDCFSISAPPKFCSDLSKKQATDLNDDGSIDGVDVNLFVRNVTTQTGD